MVLTKSCVLPQAFYMLTHHNEVGIIIIIIILTFETRKLKPKAVSHLSKATQLVNDRPRIQTQAIWPHSTLLMTISVLVLVNMCLCAGGHKSSHLWKKSILEMGKSQFANIFFKVSVPKLKLYNNGRLKLKSNKITQKMYFSYRVYLIKNNQNYFSRICKY